MSEYKNYAPDEIEKLKQLESFTDVEDYLAGMGLPKEGDTDSKVKELVELTHQLPALKEEAAKVSEKANKFSLIRRKERDKIASEANSNLHATQERTSKELEHTVHLLLQGKENIMSNIAEVVRHISGDSQLSGEFKEKIARQANKVLIEMKRRHESDLNRANDLIVAYNDNIQYITSGFRVQGKQERLRRMQFDQEVYSSGVNEKTGIRLLEGAIGSLGVQLETMVEQAEQVVQAAQNQPVSQTNKSSNSGKASQTPKKPRASKTPSQTASNKPSSSGKTNTNSTSSTSAPNNPANNPNDALAKVSAKYDKAAQEIEAWNKNHAKDVAKMVEGNAKTNNVAAKSKGSVALRDAYQEMVEAVEEIIKYGPDSITLPNNVTSMDEREIQERIKRLYKMKAAFENRAKEYKEALEEYQKSAGIKKGVSIKVGADNEVTARIQEDIDKLTALLPDPSKIPEPPKVTNASQPTQTSQPAQQPANTSKNPNTSKNNKSKNNNKPQQTQSNSTSASTQTQAPAQAASQNAPNVVLSDLEKYRQELDTLMESGPLGFRTSGDFEKLTFKVNQKGLVVRGNSTENADSFDIGEVANVYGHIVDSWLEGCVKLNNRINELSTIIQNTADLDPDKPGKAKNAYHELTQMREGLVQKKRLYQSNLAHLKKVLQSMKVNGAIPPDAKYYSEEIVKTQKELETQVSAAQQAIDYERNWIGSWASEGDIAKSSRKMPIGDVQMFTPEQLGSIQEMANETSAEIIELLYGPQGRATRQLPKKTNKTKVLAADTEYGNRPIGQDKAKIASVGFAYYDNSGTLQKAGGIADWGTENETAESLLSAMNLKENGELLESAVHLREEIGLGGAEGELTKSQIMENGKLAQNIRDKLITVKDFYNVLRNSKVLTAAGTLDNDAALAGSAVGWADIPKLIEWVARSKQAVESELASTAISDPNYKVLQDEIAQHEAVHKALTQISVVQKNDPTLRKEEAYAHQLDVRVQAARKIAGNDDKLFEQLLHTSGFLTLQNLKVMYTGQRGEMAHYSTDDAITTLKVLARNESDYLPEARKAVDDYFTSEGLASTSASGKYTEEYMSVLKAVLMNSGELEAGTANVQDIVGRISQGSPKSKSSLKERQAAVSKVISETRAATRKIAADTSNSATSASWGGSAEDRWFSGTGNMLYKRIELMGVTRFPELLMTQGGASAPQAALETIARFAQEHDCRLLIQDSPDGNSKRIALIPNRIAEAKEAQGGTVGVEDGFEITTYVPDENNMIGLTDKKKVNLMGQVLERGQIKFTDANTEQWKSLQRNFTSGRAYDALVEAMDASKFGSLEEQQEALREESHKYQGYWNSDANAMPGGLTEDERNAWNDEYEIKSVAQADAALYQGTHAILAQSFVAQYRDQINAWRKQEAINQGKATYTEIDPYNLSLSDVEELSTLFNYLGSNEESRKRSYDQLSPLAKAIVEEEGPFKYFANALSSLRDDLADNGMGLTYTDLSVHKEMTGGFSYGNALMQYDPLALFGHHSNEYNMKTKKAANLTDNAKQAVSQSHSVKNWFKPQSILKSDGEYEANNMLRSVYAVDEEIYEEAMAKALEEELTANAEYQALITSANAKDQQKAAQIKSQMAAKYAGIADKAVMNSDYAKTLEFKGPGRTISGVKSTDKGLHPVLKELMERNANAEVGDAIDLSDSAKLGLVGAKNITKDFILNEDPDSGYEQTLGRMVKDKDGLWKIYINEVGQVGKSSFKGTDRRGTTVYKEDDLRRIKEHYAKIAAAKGVVGFDEAKFNASDILIGRSSSSDMKDPRKAPTILNKKLNGLVMQALDAGIDMDVIAEAIQTDDVFKKLFKYDKTTKQMMLADGVKWDTNASGGYVINGQPIFTPNEEGANGKKSNLYNLLYGDSFGKMADYLKAKNGNFTWDENAQAMTFGAMPEYFFLGGVGQGDISNMLGTGWHMSDRAQEFSEEQVNAWLSGLEGSADYDAMKSGIEGYRENFIRSGQKVAITRKAQAKIRDLGLSYDTIGGNKTSAALNRKTIKFVTDKTADQLAEDEIAITDEMLRASLDMTPEDYEKTIFALAREKKQELAKKYRRTDKKKSAAYENAMFSILGPGNRQVLFADMEPGMLASGKVQPSSVETAYLEYLRAITSDNLDTEAGKADVEKAKTRIGKEVVTATDKKSALYREANKPLQTGSQIVKIEDTSQAAEEAHQKAYEMSGGQGHSEFVEINEDDFKERHYVSTRGKGKKQIAKERKENILKLAKYAGGAFGLEGNTEDLGFGQNVNIHSLLGPNAAKMLGRASNDALEALEHNIMDKVVAQAKTNIAEYAPIIAGLREPSLFKGQVSNVRAVLSKEVARGEMRISKGLAKINKADFDGDIMSINALYNALADGAKNVGEVKARKTALDKYAKASNEAVENISKLRERRERRKAYNKRKLTDDEKQKADQQAKDAAIRYTLSSGMQNALAMAQGTSYGSVGLASYANTESRMQREALAAIQESNGQKQTASLNRAISDVLLASGVSLFEQDAISSKKMINHLIEDQHWTAANANAAIEGFKTGKTKIDTKWLNDVAETDIVIGWMQTFNKEGYKQMADKGWIKELQDDQRKSLGAEFTEEGAAALDKAREDMIKAAYSNPKVKELVDAKHKELSHNRYIEKEERLSTALSGGAAGVTGANGVIEGTGPIDATNAAWDEHTKLLKYAIKLEEQKSGISKDLADKLKEEAAQTTAVGTASKAAHAEIQKENEALGKTFETYEEFSNAVRNGLNFGDALRDATANLGMETSNVAVRGIGVKRTDDEARYDFTGTMSAEEKKMALKDKNGKVKIHSLTQLSNILKPFDNPDYARKRDDFDTAFTQFASGQMPGHNPATETFTAEVAGYAVDPKTGESADFNKMRSSYLASDAGTFVHGIIDTLAKATQGKDAKDITEADIQAAMTNYTNSTEGQAVVDKFGKFGLDAAQYTNAVASIKSFLSNLTDMGMNLTQITETPLGMLVKVGGKIIAVAGTLDQVLMDAQGNLVISDNKLKEMVKGEQGFQLAGQLALLAANRTELKNKGLISQEQETALAQVGDIAGEDNGIKKLINHLSTEGGSSILKILGVGTTDFLKMLVYGANGQFDKNGNLIIGNEVSRSLADTDEVSAMGSVGPTIARHTSLDVVGEYKNDLEEILKMQDNLNALGNKTDEASKQSLQVLIEQFKNTVNWDDYLKGQEVNTSTLADLADVLLNNAVEYIYKNYDASASPEMAKTRAEKLSGVAGARSNFQADFIKAVNYDDPQAKANIRQFIQGTKQVNKINLDIERAQMQAAGMSGSELTAQNSYIAALQAQKSDIAAQMPEYNKNEGSLGRIKLTQEQLESLTQTVNRLSNEYDSSSAKLKANVKVQSGLIDKLKSQFSSTFTQMGAMITEAFSFYRLRQYLNQVISTIEQMDSKMVDLQIASGSTRTEVQSMMKDFSNLAAEIGKSTVEVANAANDWLRAGYAGQEAAKLTEASMQLATLGQLQSSDATSYLISVLKGWKISASEVTDVVSKLVAVDMSAAVSAGELAEAMSRGNNVAQLTGSTMNKYMSYITTVADATQQSASIVGTSMRTIYSRYQNVAAGKLKAAQSDINSSNYNEDEWSGLNDVETALNSLGIKIRSSVGTFKDFDDVMEEIAGKWDSFTTVQQAGIATSMAGTRQREAFTTLMSNWDSVNKYEKIAENSKGTAENKMRIYEDSVEAYKTRISTAVEQFVADAKGSRVIKDFYKAITQILNQLDKWAATLAVLSIPKLISGAQKILLFIDREANNLGSMFSPKNIKWHTKGAWANQNQQLLEKTESAFRQRATESLGGILSTNGAFTENQKVGYGSLQDILMVDAKKGPNGGKLYQAFAKQDSVDAYDQEIFGLGSAYRSSLLRAAKGIEGDKYNENLRNEMNKLLDVNTTEGLNFVNAWLKQNAPTTYHNNMTSDELQAAKEKYIAALKRAAKEESENAIITKELNNVKNDNENQGKVIKQNVAEYKKFNAQIEAVSNTWGGMATTVFGLAASGTGGYGNALKFLGANDNLAESLSPFLSTAFTSIGGASVKGLFKGIEKKKVSSKLKKQAEEKSAKAQEAEQELGTKESALERANASLAASQKYLDDLKQKAGQAKTKYESLPENDPGKGAALGDYNAALGEIESYETETYAQALKQQKEAEVERDAQRGIVDAFGAEAGEFNSQAEETEKNSGWMMLAGGAGAALSTTAAVLSALQKISDREEQKMIEKSQTASQNYQKALEVSSTFDEFEKLSEGVSTLGKNITLTDEEYATFLEESNALTEAFPGLSYVVDDAGNKIVQFGNSAESVSEQLEALLEEKQTAADQAKFATASTVMGDRSEFGSVLKELDNSEDTSVLGGSDLVELFNPVTWGNLFKSSEDVGKAALKGARGARRGIFNAMGLGSNGFLLTEQEQEAVINNYLENLDSQEKVNNASLSEYVTSYARSSASNKVDFDNLSDEQSAFFSQLSQNINRYFDNGQAKSSSAYLADLEQVLKWFNKNLATRSGQTLLENYYKEDSEFADLEEYAASREELMDYLERLKGSDGTYSSNAKSVIQAFGMDVNDERTKIIDEGNVAEQLKSLNLTQITSEQLGQLTVEDAKQVYEYVKDGTLLLDDTFDKALTLLVADRDFPTTIEGMTSYIADEAKMLNGVDVLDGLDSRVRDFYNQVKIYGKEWGEENYASIFGDTTEATREAIKSGMDSLDLEDNENWVENSKEAAESVAQTAKDTFHEHEAELSAALIESIFPSDIEIEGQIDTYKELNTALTETANSYKRLADAQREQNKTGSLSLATVLSLLESNSNYASVLVYEKGKIKLADDAVQQMTKAQLLAIAANVESAKSKLEDTIQTNEKTLAEYDAELATLENALATGELEDAYKKAKAAGEDQTKTIEVQTQSMEQYLAIAEATAETLEHINNGEYAEASESAKRGLEAAQKQYVTEEENTGQESEGETEDATTDEERRKLIQLRIDKIKSQRSSLEKQLKSEEKQLEVYNSSLLQEISNRVASGEDLDEFLNDLGYDSGNSSVIQSLLEAQDQEIDKEYEAFKAYADSVNSKTDMSKYYDLKKGSLSALITYWKKEEANASTEEEASKARASWIKYQNELNNLDDEQVESDMKILELQDASLGILIENQKEYIKTADTYEELLERQEKLNEYLAQQNELERSINEYKRSNLDIAEQYADVNSGETLDFSEQALNTYNSDLSTYEDDLIREYQKAWTGVYDSTKAQHLKNGMSEEDADNLATLAANEEAENAEAVQKAIQGIYKTYQSISEETYNSLTKNTEKISELISLTEKVKPDEWQSSAQIDEYYNRLIGTATEVGLLQQQVQEYEKILKDEEELKNLTDEQIQTLYSSYLDAVKSLQAAEEERLQAQIDLQEKQYSALTYQINLYKEELQHQIEDIEEAYEDEIEPLQQVNEELERQIKLQDLLDAKKKASKEKERVYVEGVGWTYRANTSAQREAQQNLDDFYRQDKLDDLEKAKNAEVDLLQDRIDAWDKYLEAIEWKYKEQERIENQKLLYELTRATTEAGVRAYITTDMTNFNTAVGTSYSTYNGNFTDFLSKYQENLNSLDEKKTTHSNTLSALSRTLKTELENIQSYNDQIITNIDDKITKALESAANNIKTAAEEAARIAEEAAQKAAEAAKGVAKTVEDDDEDDTTGDTGGGSTTTKKEWDNKILDAASKLGASNTVSEFKSNYDNYLSVIKQAREAYPEGGWTTDEEAYSYAQDVAKGKWDSWKSAIAEETDTWVDKVNSITDSRGKSPALNEGVKAINNSIAQQNDVAEEFGLANRIAAQSYNNLAAITYLQNLLDDIQTNEKTILQSYSGRGYYVDYQNLRKVNDLIEQYNSYLKEHSELQTYGYASINQWTEKEAFHWAEYFDSFKSHVPTEISLVSQYSDLQKTTRERLAQKGVLSTSKNGVSTYSTGIEQGPVTYTGLAMLHGSPSSPEYVLNSDQAYNLLRNFSTLKMPEIESKFNSTSMGTQYIVQGDIVLEDVNDPAQFWSDVTQAMGNRYNVTKNKRNA